MQPSSLLCVSLTVGLSAALACGSLACSTPSTPLGPWPDGGVPNPGPGDQVDIAFNNTPSNGTPDQATALGTSTMDGVTVWIGENTIGGAGNESNYFVFRAGTEGGPFAFDGCFGSPITSMTGSFWEVVEAKQVTPPVATWSATAGCFSNATAMMEPNTVYLFGLTATGGPGTYSL